MQGLVVLVVLAALVAVTSSHSFEWGSCRAKGGLEDFNPEAFAGLWYVIEVSSTTSSCFSLFFNVVPGGFVVQESQELHAGRVIGLNVKMGAHVNYTILEGSTMYATGQTDISFFDGATATVIGTDYTTYATMYECQQWLFVRRVELAILSRTPTLTPETIAELKSNLQDIDINTRKLDKINQEGCSEDPDFSFQIDNIPGLFGNDEMADDLENLEEDGDAETFIEGDPTENIVF